jgi:hypothetical protein
MNKDSASAKREVFRIHNSGFDFTTGNSAQGEQVLIGLNLGYKRECVEALFFDSNGEFLRQEKRPLNVPEGSGIASMGNPGIRKQVTGLFASWKNDLGFSPGVIHVKRFNVDRVGIEDRPSTYEAFLRGEDCDGIVDEERSEFMNSVRKWDDAGMFIFWWGKDYWMNADGTIHST